MKLVRLPQITYNKKWHGRLIQESCNENEREKKRQRKRVRVGDGETERK